MTLEARNLTVKVNRKTLIRDISLRVEPGEVLAIIGPNGAGKSTLQRALSGDIKPDSGEVFMDGRELNQWNLRDRARMRGILSQSVTLSFAFSVLQVVLMGRGPHTQGRESTRDYEIVHRAMKSAEILHLEDRIYTTLSGGERQRVQLARVMAQIWEPLKIGSRYLMMDEPTNNLDLANQHRALQIARRFAADGVAVLLILHDLNLAAQYADRVMMMCAGDHLFTGSPESILTTERIRQTFNMDVMVTQHPLLDCPLIVPASSGNRMRTSDPIVATAD